MKVIIKTQLEDYELECKDVKYSLKHGDIVNMIFCNPNKDLPVWFKVKNISEFHDDGSTIEIVMR